ncbi:MAG: hypothetical protein ABR601_09630, partial [Parasphingopyxis sp.]
MLPFALALLLAVTGHSARAADESTHWFTILTADGQRIGHASQQVSEDGDGQRIREESVIFVREGDKPRTRIASETITRIDAEGLVFSITETGRVAGEVTRTSALI